jgi:CubicO group peptidase (beta-lactamase class C family)
VNRTTGFSASHRTAAAPRVAGRRPARSRTVGGRPTRALALLLALVPVLLGGHLAHPTEPLWETLAADLDALRVSGNVPAMGLVIVDQRRPVLVRGLGSAGPDTPFRWGSITKSFTALAALALVAEHHLDPNLNVDELLGACCFQNRWAASHPVRLRQLLELSAGFPDLSRAEFDDNTPRPLEESLRRGREARRTLWPPGLQHSYSNVPPGLTAAVIEQVSGQSFESYLKSRVLKPLGMTRAGLGPVPDLPGGHRADGRTPIPYWHMTFAGFGALNASTAELGRYATALLNEGRLEGAQALPAALVAALFRPEASLGARHGLAVTYAAGIYGRVREGHVFWGHGGDADGYLSRYGLLLDQGRGYVIVINSDNPPLLGRMVRRLERALVSGLTVRRPEVVDDPDLSSYVGTYYPSSARFGADRWARGESPQARVERVGDALELERDGRRTRLLPLGAGRFRRPDDPAATAVFVRDAGGALYLQGEMGNYVKLSKTSCPAFLAQCE